MDAEFQSWEEGFWGTNRRERGTGGETGRRGVSLTSLHESHSEDDRERGYRTPSATRYRTPAPSATLCGSEVTGSGWFFRLCCGESETEVNEVNSSESSRFGLLHFK